jgi:hypothetical protein
MKLLIYSINYDNNVVKFYKNYEVSDDGMGKNAEIFSEDFSNIMNKTNGRASFALLNSVGDIIIADFANNFTSSFTPKDLKKAFDYVIKKAYNDERDKMDRALGNRYGGATRQRTTRKTTKTSSRNTL